MSNRPTPEIEVLVDFLIFDARQLERAAARPLGDLSLGYYERCVAEARAAVLALVERLEQEADHPPAVEEKGGWEPLSRMEREENP